VGPETQGGPQVLRRHCSVDHLLCTLSMVAWHSKSKCKKKLNKVQRLACLRITGALRTTPIGAMEALAGLPPLDLLIHGEASSAAHRLWSWGVGQSRT
jgi:hypothetical protein